MRAWPSASSRPSRSGAAAGDRVCEVLELEPVRVDRLELDALGAVVAPELDHRLLAVPGVVQEQRPLGADRLELVALGEARSAVEERDDVAGEAHRTREDPVGAARADVRVAVHALGLACEEP